MQHFKISKPVRILALALAMILCLQVFAPTRASAATVNSQSAVQQTLNAIANGSKSIDSSTVMAVGRTFTGTRSGEQCKGYAKNVFIILWGVNPGSTQAKPNNYLLSNPSSVKKVGSVTNITTSNISSLFSGARVGDFVQMRRSHGGSHSAIVYAISSSGVTFLEANTDGKNTIMKNTYTWSSLCTKNAAMSVYTSTSYTAATGYAGTSASSSTSAKSNASVAEVEALLFDATFYANIYADLRNAFGYNSASLINHWLNHGISEGRVASPFFDAKWYLANNPDVAKAYGSTNYKAAYDHFTHHGFNEGRQGSPYFSATYYLNKYSDLKNAFGSNYLAAARHFLSNGLSEGRQASAQFNISVYNSCNPDVVRTFSNPLYRISHYIAYVQYGSESRRCV